MKVLNATALFTLKQFIYVNFTTIENIKVKG